MKKIRNKLAIFFVVLSLFSISFSSFAQSCLDVRDYGFHRYNQRHVSRVDISAEALGPTEDGYIKVKVYYQDYGYCVCGAYGPTYGGTGYYYKYIPI